MLQRDSAPLQQATTGRQQRTARSSGALIWLMCSSSDLLCVQRLDKLVDLKWVLPGGWTTGKKTAEEMRAEERNLKAQKLQIAKDNQTGLLGFFSGVSNSALTAQLVVKQKLVTIKLSDDEFGALVGIKRHDELMAVATELLGLEPGAELKEAWDVSSGTCEGGELLKPSREGSLSDELTSGDVLKFNIPHFEILCRSCCRSDSILFLKFSNVTPGGWLVLACRLT